MPEAEGISDQEVLRQTIEVLTRKKVPAERLSIMTLMQIFVDDPRLGLKRPELQGWFREASSQAIFILYNRVKQVYLELQKK